ncbi:hypothetical protein [Isoptericola sp. NPDC019482]|uniref:hypothetical protein n=1 Tax=Isoptericola sp. NPDC019482 TaxID=3154688 RepID=UPI00347DD472
MWPRTPLTVVPSRTRRLFVVVLVVVVGLAALVTVVGLLWPQEDAASSAAPAPAAGHGPDDVVTTATPPSSDADLDPVQPSSDPVEFARAAAVELLAWDTTQPVPRSAYMERLIAVGDPTGEQTPGLVADLEAYLPSDGAWAHLSQYSTRQWLTITDAVVPETWAHVVATTPADRLAPGTVAVTISGTRHRAGVWEDAPVTDRSAVAFTVFVACEPAYPTCALLRLGAPDNPMP